MGLFSLKMPHKNITAKREGFDASNHIVSLNIHATVLEKVKFRRLTLKQFGRCVGRTAAEGVQFVARHELIAEAKVRYLDVHVAVQQEVLRLCRHNTCDMQANIWRHLMADV